LAATALDQDNLKQIAMTVGANGPIMNGRARGDPLDVNEIKCLIVRRIAVEMEQRQRRGAVLAGHGPSICRSWRKANGGEDVAGITGRSARFARWRQHRKAASRRPLPRSLCFSFGSGERPRQPSSRLEPNGLFRPLLLPAPTRSISFALTRPV